MNTPETTNYEFPYGRPRSRSCWYRIWNPETYQLFGRTATSWGGILLFYAIFYCVLAALFAICLKGLTLTLDNKNPKWLLNSSLIGTNPGLGFRPIFGDDDSALVRYNASKRTDYKKWTDQLDEFLAPYIVQPGKNQQACDYNQPPAEGKACDVPITGWEPCTKEMGYSYNRSSPCIFIKLNKIIDWLPEYYKDIDELPDEMPTDLKEYIRKKAKTMNMVWVSCEGETVADKANLGDIKYIPDRGFPGYYYPYRNIDGYLSPLIALHLVRPKLNVLINIECRAWAKNIQYSRVVEYREGSVHFEVMIDKAL